MDGALQRMFRRVAAPFIRLDFADIDRETEETRAFDAWSDDDMVCHRAAVARSFVQGEGIEIGALHNPLPLPPDARVRYVDYKTKAENEARYPELSARTIVNTDIIDDGFILRKVARSSCDFLIANHALEHSPDPYGTLLRWKSRLRRNGVILAAVPVADKCFDRGRRITSLEHVWNDHQNFRKLRRAEVLATTLEHLREFITVSDRNIRIENGLPLLDAEGIEESCRKISAKLAAAIPRCRSYESLVTACVERLNKTYDIHYHTFSPSSYRRLLAFFAEREGCRVELVRKSGSGECMGVLRRL
ncbi:MAG TPA: hypothetical protein VD978_25800 [Azospirillum sp.]|nr:hypothetical protein [Azospirillum sp.]